MAGNSVDLGGRRIIKKNTHPTRPAAPNTTPTQARSRFALWVEDPPPSPDLDDAVVIDVLDGAVSGNWMIRGFGVPAPVVEVPTLAHAGLMLLALLLGGAAVLRLRSGLRQS